MAFFNFGLFVSANLLLQQLERFLLGINYRKLLLLQQSLETTRFPFSLDNRLMGCEQWQFIKVDCIRVSVKRLMTTALIPARLIQKHQRVLLI